MQMGKVSLRDEQSQYSKNIRQKPMTSVKKSVRITYISRPVTTVRACDASEFRALVQQLTGKDSNQCVQMTNGEPQHQVLELDPPMPMAPELDVYDCTPSYYNIMELDSHSLYFDQEASSWKQVSHNMAVLQSPSYVLV